MQLPDDSLRTVLHTVFAAPAYAWVDEPHPFIAVQEWWRRLADWLVNARTLHPLVFQGLVLALTAVLVAIVVHAVYVFLQTVRAAARREGSAFSSAPVSGRDASWYLGAADQAAAAGHYRDALRLAFDALVVRLDAMGSIHWAPGKTARDYTREARLTPLERDRLGRVVGVLYRHVYSGVPCGPDEYAALRGAASDDWHAAAD
ncbi:MAG TPA: DUF4129 domain-containing protein [Gemmatimonadales bacterium]|nr:DUF4129 domain-containing protein [Gemmatimonadales bacterium]